MALAILGLQACVKIGVTGDPIAFSPVASKATKAIIDGTQFPHDVSFSITAIHTNGVYFDDQLASYDNGMALWATAPAQYWPLSGSLNFYSYAPANVATTSGATLSMDDDYGVCASNYTCDGETDFLFASYSVADCNNRLSSVVPLDFRHALSQIVVKIRQQADYNTEINNKSNIVSISVDNVSLTGAYVSANFQQLPQANWTITQSSSTGSYTFLASTQNLTYGATPIQLDRILAIPQYLEGVALHVVYTVRQTITDNTTSETSTLSVTNPVDIPLSDHTVRWECGTRYIYTLSFGLNPIEVTAQTADWIPDGGEVLVEEE